MYKLKLKTIIHRKTYARVMHHDVGTSCARVMHHDVRTSCARVITF